MSSCPFIFGARSSGAVPLEGISDSSQSPVYYIGWSSDNTNYAITRITRNIDNTISTAEAVGDWADRYTLIYT